MIVGRERTDCIAILDATVIAGFIDCQPAVNRILIHPFAADFAHDLDPC